MKSITISLWTVLLLSTGLVSAENRACHTGILLDVQVSRENVHLGGQTTTIEEHTKKNGDKEYSGYTSSNDTTTTIYTVTVKSGGMIYTARSGAWLFGFKPTSFVVNDPVEVCIESKKLILMRPDGKEYKSTIVRAERETTSPLPDGKVQTTSKENPTLQSRSAVCQVMSTPSGADIEIDGAFVGNTPSKIELTTGDHDLTVSKNGYKPFARKLHVTSGDLTINAELQR